MTTPTRRAALLDALGYLQKQLPHFAVHGLDVMDDSTLLAIVMMGLAALYAYYGSGTEPTITIDYALPSMSGSQPQAPVAPSPQPQPQPSQPQPTPQPPVLTGAGDAFDLSQAAITGGSPDVRGWPITTQLSIAQIEPAIVPAFTDPGWPDVIPPGFDGPIQYTVWAFAFVNGQWIGAGFIEMWRGRPDCGNNDAGDVRDQLARNWWYRAAGMAGYTPAPGDAIGFMVTPGDARDGKGPFPLAERSNVVVVNV